MKKLIMFALIVSSYAFAQQEKSLDQQLIDAIDFGDINRVRNFITQGANPNALDKFGFYTALDHALMMHISESGQSSNEVDQAKVQELLAHGAQPTIKNFYSAINRGFSPEIVKLIQSKISVDINQKDSSGLTPLMRAVDSGSIDLVNYFLQQGAQVQVQQAPSLVVFAVDSYYAGRSNLDMLKLILQNGAKVGNIAQQTIDAGQDETKKKAVKDLIASMVPQQ